MRAFLIRAVLALFLCLGVVIPGCAPPDTAPQISLHWTGGSHTWQPPNKPYHILVAGNGQVIQTRSLAVPGAHVWGRNTNNIGISLMAMADGYPVRPIQVERMACVVAELVHAKGIPITRVRDHAYHARTTIPPYTSLRWDIGPYYPLVMAKVPWYLARTKKRRAAGQPYELIANFY